MRVLLAEDNKTDVDLFRRALVLALHDLRLDDVPTLALARRALSAVRYDVVVMDLRLPGSTPTETAEALLRDAQGAAVLAWSGNEDLDLSRALVRAGLDDVIHKDTAPPIEIARRVLYALERRRRVDALEVAASCDPADRSSVLAIEREVQGAKLGGAGVVRR